MEFENNRAKDVRGDGEWSLHSKTYTIPYHPQHTATVEFILALCEHENEVVGLMVDIRNIEAEHKLEQYEYAIKRVLARTLEEEFFGTDSLEVPF